MEKFIKDKRGQWAHPGKNTLIPNVNGRITMKGVGYPLLGIDDEGNSAVMQPGGEYQFPGNNVYEIPLTEDEAMAYAANGYILEELHEGGEPGHDHNDPPSYEDAMQAYKDSMAAKEAYEEGYKKKEKDYLKLKANYDRYNKAYLNNKKMWELIDSIDPKSNPYVDIDSFPSFNQGPNAYKLYQNLPSDIKEQLGFPEFDKRDIGQRFNPKGGHSVTYSGTEENPGSENLIDLYHLHEEDLVFKYPKDDPEYKPNLVHSAYPTVTNWNYRFYPEDQDSHIELKENFPIASVYDVHPDSFKNITDKDVKVINFFGHRNSELDYYNREILKLLKDSGIDLTGMILDKRAQSKKQILDRLIKLQEPDKIGSLEYNPPEVLERPTFADYVDPMPVIKPELTVDASLPEELVEGEDFNNDYKTKRVVDKIKMPRINKRGKIRRGPFGTKTTRSVRYEPIEEEQIYPEGFVPRFYNEGGYVEVELNDEEADKYRAGGYVLEELPKAQDAGQVNGIKSLMEFQQDFKAPKITKSDRTLVYGEPGFKEQQTTYIAQGKTPSTIEQIKQSDTVDQIKQRMLKSVTPYGYDAGFALREFLQGENAPMPYEDMSGNKTISWDNFENARMFGLNPERGRYVKKAADEGFLCYLYPEKCGTEIFRKSNFKPTSSKNPDSEYKSFANDDDVWDDVINYNIIDGLKTNGNFQLESLAGGSTLGHYTLSKGYDEKRKLPYVSYYDKYDLDKIPGMDSVIGTPFEIYGRMYYDPKTKERLFPDQKKLPKKEDGGESNDIAIYSTILNGIDAPVTDENLKFLKAWRQAEKGTAANNPFNTTYELDVDQDKTDYNSVGVKNYSTPEHGIAATIKTLQLPYYKNIVSGLQNDAGASNIAANTDELKTWGTGAGVARVLGGGKINPPPIKGDDGKSIYNADPTLDDQVAVVPEVAEPVEEKRSFRDLLDLVEEDDVAVEEKQEVTPTPIGIQAVEDPFPIYSQAMAAMGTPLYTDVQQRMLASQQYMKDGGFILDLDENDVAKYVANGYIVEELPKAQNGIGNWNSGTPFPASNTVPKLDMVGDAIKQSPEPVKQEPVKQEPVNTTRSFTEDFFNRSLRDKISNPDKFNPVIKQDFDFSVVDPVDSESTDTAPEYTRAIGSMPERLLTSEENLELAKNAFLENSTYKKIDNVTNYMDNLSKYESEQKNKAKNDLIDSYKNASKEEIKVLQRQLQEKGFNIGASGADGIFGKNTKKALEQKLANESLDLSAVDKYYNKYKSDKSPQTTQQVVDIQNKLVEEGFLKSSQVDGKFGPITKAAFEKSNRSKDPNAIFFTNIPTKLKEEQCAKGMCQILEQNDILTEALGVKYRNAWDIKENMDRKKNSTEVYNIYDNPAFDNVKSGSQLVKTTRQVKAKSSTTADMYKTGDIVGIFWPNSSHHGDVLNSKTHNTHVGFVSGVKNGVPQITHNVHGDVRTEPYSNLFTGWIQRPNKNVNLQNVKYDFKDQEFEDIDNVVNNAEIKKERSFTTSEKSNIKNTIKRVHSDAINLTEALGSSVDPDWLESATVGILGVETGIGLSVPRSRDDKGVITQAGYKLKDVKDEDISLGLSKTKFSQLDDFSKSYFDIKSWKDLGDDKKAAALTTYNLIKHYDTFKDYAQQFPELNLTEDDIRSMSILAHNRGTKKLLTLGRRGAKGTRNYYKGSEEDMFFQEVQKLRDMSRVGAYQSDISSTDWKYLPGAEYLPADLTGKISETYVSKVKRYIADLYGDERLGEQNEQEAAQQSIYDTPYYRGQLSNKKEGGEFFELQLNEDEVAMYLNGGYIVEEIK